jgi:hypothetical protein
LGLPRLSLPATVGDFAALWDAFEQPRAAYVLDSVDNRVLVHRTGVGSEAHMLVASIPDDGRAAADVPMLLAALDPRESSRFGPVDRPTHVAVGMVSTSTHAPPEAGPWWRFSYWLVDQPHIALYVPGHTATIAIDPRPALSDRARMNWAPQPFAVAFADLNALIENLTELPLPSAQTVIAREVARQQPSVELLGLHVPLRVVQQWSLFVILVLQAYLWIHLSRLEAVTTAGDKAWGFPWIALYPAVPARVVSAASMLILPLAAACAVGWTEVRLGFSVRASVLWLELITLVGALAACGYTWTRVLARRGSIDHPAIERTGGPTSVVAHPAPADRGPLRDLEDEAGRSTELDRPL